MELRSQAPAVAQVFQTVLVHGPLSRAEIGRRTGLSSGAVTKAATPLLADGWIAELGRPEAGRPAGRPATLVAVRAERANFLGVKVTADELIGVRIDLTGKPVAARRATLDSRDVDSVVQAIARLVRPLVAAPGGARAAEIGGLGVTISGDVDRETGAVHHSPFLNWHGVPLAQLVQDATGIPTVIENDVRALTVAEQWFGAGAGLSSFAVVTVGTGIGCGLFVNGQVISGAHGVAGEIGHLPVHGADRMCTCGNIGCVEAVSATQPIVEQARQATGNMRLSMTEAVRLAHDGNAAVRAIFTQAGTRPWPGPGLGRQPDRARAHHHLGRGRRLLRPVRRSDTQDLHGPGVRRGRRLRADCPAPAVRGVGARRSSRGGPAPGRARKAGPVTSMLGSNQKVPVTYLVEAPVAGRSLAASGLSSLWSACQGPTLPRRPCRRCRLW